MQYVEQSGPPPPYAAPIPGTVPPRQLLPERGPVLQQQATFAVGQQTAAQERKKKKKPQVQQPQPGGISQHGYEYPQLYVPP